MLIYLFLNSCPDYNMCLWGDVYIMKVTKDRATLWHNNPLALVTRIEIISDTKLLHENMQGISSSKLEQPELGRRNSRQSHISCKLISSSNTAPWAFTFQHKKPASGPIIHREVNLNLPGKQDIPNICHATLLLRKFLRLFHPVCVRRSNSWYIYTHKWISMKIFNMMPYRKAFSCSNLSRLHLNRLTMNFMVKSPLTPPHKNIEITFGHLRFLWVSQWPSLLF